MKIIYSEYIFKSELYNNIMLMNSLYKDNIHINNNNITEILKTVNPGQIFGSIKVPGGNEEC